MLLRRLLDKSLLFSCNFYFNVLRKLKLFIDFLFFIFITFLLIINTSYSENMKILCIVRLIYSWKLFS